MVSIVVLWLLSNIEGDGEASYTMELQITTFGERRLLRSVKFEYQWVGMVKYWSLQDVLS